MLWPAQPLTVHWLNSRTNHVHHLHRNNGLLKALQLVSTLPNVGYLALLLVLENSIGVWVTGYNYLASSLDSPALLHTSHAAKFYWALYKYTSFLWLFEIDVYLHLLATKTGAGLRIRSWDPKKGLYIVPDASHGGLNNKKWDHGGIDHQIVSSKLSCTFEKLKK